MPPITLPTDFAALAALTLLLGMRHGLDADHLAAIDGMTRFNALRRPRLARRVGALFSLGHGLVVLGVTLAVSHLPGPWQPPGWLADVGAWMSIVLLSGLGLLNLGALRRTPVDQPVRLQGWRSRLLPGRLATGRPLAVMAVGAVFAISFDTIGQAALMATATARFGSPWPAPALALLFVSGMLLSDGLSSLWVHHLVRRSASTAQAASRLMAAAVVAGSLLTAALGVALQASPAAAAWADGKAHWFSLSLVAAVLLAFSGGLLLARRAEPQVSTAASAMATSKMR